MTRRRLLLAAGGAVLLSGGLAAAGAAWGRWWRLPRFEAVRPGVLYRSAAMPTAATQRRVLERSGARTVVILRSEAEMEEGEWYQRERRLAHEAGARVVEIPMAYDTPPRRDQVRRFLEVVDDPAARPVLVHCEAGVVRTGMMVAVYRMEREGWSPEEALEEFQEHAGRRSQDPRRRHILQFIRSYRVKFKEKWRSPAGRAPQ
jgi:protein tyrosine/serine phosphatase